MPEDRFLLREEVAERLRCSYSTVKRLCRDGELAYLPGRPVKIRESDLAAYIENNIVRAEKPPRQPSPRPPGVSAVEADARMWALRSVLLKPDQRNPRKPKA
jgi:excisionase family DNA binding protein